MPDILDIVCQPLIMPDQLPEMELPNFGPIQKAWGAMGHVPDPGDLLAQFQDMITPAMAPIRRWMMLQQLAQQIYNCIKAVPESILTLSPDPVLDCTENLTKYLMQVLKMVPPLSYVAYGMSVVRYCRMFIDEVFLLYQAMDQVISGYASLASDAALIVDTELQNQISCGVTELLPPLVQSADQMGFVKPAMDTLINPFLMLPGGNALKPLLDQFTSADDYISDVRDQVAGGSSQSPLPTPPFAGFVTGSVTQPPFVPFPPLGPLVFVLGFQRQMLTQIYNLLSPLAQGVTVRPIGSPPIPMLVSIETGTVIGPPLAEDLPQLPSFSNF